MTRNCFLNFLLATAISGGIAYSGNLSIGVANAVGSFSLNNATVQGSTSVSDGAQLETASSPSEVQLQNGANVRLSAKSSGTVYSDHAVLQRGAMRIENFDKYALNVRELQIQADNPQAEAIVRLKGNTVEVASLGGSVRVGDGASMLTHVAAGTRMSFQQSATQSGTQTGSKPVSSLPSDNHILIWFIAATAGAAIALGCIAGVKGKNPF